MSILNAVPAPGNAQMTSVLVNYNGLGDLRRITDHDPACKVVDDAAYRW
jgi:hypothetical protein